MQSWLKKATISRGLAKDLNVPAWRRMTSWNGILSLMRTALGLKDRDISAVEAALEIVETAMWQHPEGAGDLMEARGRAWMAKEKEFQESKAARGPMPGAKRKAMSSPPSQEEPPETKELVTHQSNLGKAYDKLVPDVGKAIVHDTSLNAGHWMTKAKVGLQSGVQLAGMWRNKFMDGKGKGSILDAINDAVAGREVHRERLNDMDREFLGKTATLAKSYPDEMGAYGKLLNDSTKYDVRADGKAPKIRDVNKPENQPMDDWQGNDNYAEMNAAYKKLSPAVQQHYADYHEFLRGKANALGEEHLRQIIKLFDPPKVAGLSKAESRKALLERALDHDLTDDDKEHFEKLGLSGEIGRAYALTKPSATYFSAFRDGDNVVTGRYPMPEGGGETGHDGEKLRDDTRAFKTRKEAHDYAVGTKLKASTRIVHYAEDSPGNFIRVQEPDSEVKEFHVTVQREHTEMHRTPAEAEAARKDMITHGVKNVSQVLDKRQQENWRTIGGGAAGKFENMLKDRDDLSPTERDKMIQTSRQLLLSQQAGNRLGTHWNEKRNISGANWKEIYEAAHNYSTAANYHISYSKSLPAIDEAMKRLEDHASTNQEGPDAKLISVIRNSYQDRVYGGPDVVSPKVPQWLRGLRVLGFTKYVLTPHFIVQHQIHPLAYTAPHMAGRFGYMHSVNYLRQAANDVGGNIPNITSGMKSSAAMAKALLGFGTDAERVAGATPLNIMDQIIARRIMHNGREARMLRNLQDRGKMGNGFTDEALGSSGLAKVEAVMGQTTNAMEATNRSIAALGSYRAEYDRLTQQGKSSEEAHDLAVEYASQTVEKSMGVFSGGTMAPMLKHPLIRAALQFKQFPMQANYALIRNLHDIFKGDTPEVKKEAVRALASQLGSAAVMSGAHGMPLAALKAVALLGMALGISPSPSQIDDRLRRSIAKHMSPTVANVFMDGLSGMSPYAPDMSHMFGYNDDIFSEPYNNDWKSAMWDAVGGAPASSAGDTMKGLNHVMHGDWAKAVGELSPLGIVSNAFKAYTLDTQGLQTGAGLKVMGPSGLAAAWKALGFTTEGQTRAYAGRTALEQDIQDTKSEKRKALDAARHGDSSAYLKWNAANPNDKITAEQASNARHGMSSESILGVKVTGKNRDKLKEYQNVYE